MEKHLRKIKWGAVLLLVLTIMLIQLYGWNWSGYVQSWGGTFIKAMSGGFLGWFISRYVLDLNLSDIHEDHRAMAGLSQAILVAGFAMAVTNGA